MNMPDVLNYSNGSTSYAPLRHQTRLALKCSTSGMELCTQMELIIKKGFAAINAKILITWRVLHLKKKRKSLTHSFAPLMNAGSSLPTKWVIKRVTVPTFFLVPGPHQKTTAKKRRGMDGRVIVPRKDASTGRDVKEQKWSVQDMDEVFNLWEKNNTLPLIRNSPRGRSANQQGCPTPLSVNA